ncbi:phosphoribosylformylglycinamidine synthase [Gudongella sp. DL1XJH-153]|uniref:phosphoribosylformylglycinamidine synthase n=1 Tax=Gudongella sp. DL1XJH-153 TaxID=3409804 RepID=UPI003BB4D553
MVVISDIRRVYVEKREGFDVEAMHMLHEIRESLEVAGLESVRILNRYDFTCKDEESFGEIVNKILSEPNVDIVHNTDLPQFDGKALAIEYLPGQYDQRADSAEQCIQILLGDMDAKVKAAKVLLLVGEITDEDFKRVKEYIINPVDSREASMAIPRSLLDQTSEPEDVKTHVGFIDFSDEELESFRQEMSFAMSFGDIELIRDYFRNDEKRDPTVTELKVIDTYWSDHCRHTTFFTEIEDIKIQEGKYQKVFQDSLDRYYESRMETGVKKPVSLMDLATINARETRKNGLLDNLDISDEINACSIEIDVDIDGNTEKWLLMFKNETHNHPTEIEPFGGAATCLGGAIRDPLSGRSYVYQAMRVTGSGDPRTPMDQTIPGKLPQRKVTREAAKGYSSYGNQIGLSTGQVTEIYHEGYVAKRMEVGAVIAAAPKLNVIRIKPKSGDIVLLVGGKTGRDGIGGATGSSKSHTEESLETSGAEVQKGNAPEERKIQRLFRKPELASLIKKCNDFGAGGVSVAIGELADSITIDLDVIPKKYEGLNGTELAISESQERMAVVIDPKDLEEFKQLGRQENLEVTKVADITDTGRLIMNWKGNSILDIKREFLDTNGARQFADVVLASPAEKNREKMNYSSFQEGLEKTLSDLNVCSQKGMNAMFDNTVGAATVLMPEGGKYRLTPIEGMAAKIPVLEGETTTASLMTFGYDPEICEWSPYHGGVYSVLQAISKLVAMGGDYTKARLSMQEYFEKLEKDPLKWGKPFSALLGAYIAQSELGIAAIGGKDSMSGTFNDISVPPTIITFAVTTDKTKNILSPEFKKTDSEVYLAEIKTDENDLPNFDEVRKTYVDIKSLIDKGVILSAMTVSNGGIAASISKMSFGNKIGFKFDNIEQNELYDKKIGSILVEVDASDVDKIPENFRKIGTTISEQKLIIGEESVGLDKLIDIWLNTLKGVFPIKLDVDEDIRNLTSDATPKPYGGIKIARPKVFIPVFPGTNSEYDSIRAFQKAGGIVSSTVFRNQSSEDINDSLKEWASEISKSQILMIPGGFSAGDEPEGSGKFIATIFRNPYLSEAVMDLLKNRDGLVLGICNGFQALIKLGLLPNGEIGTIDETSPTITFNRIGRHISQLQPTRVVSKLSPWFANTEVGEIYTMPLSHGEGRFVAKDDVLTKLIENGQIVSQYVDLEGNATYDGYYNPNGSLMAVEALTSPDGRVLGKMGHSERIADDIYKNIPGEKNQRLFQAGIDYFG